MPIILINGSNGHGKGQLETKMILDYHKANDVLEKKGQERRVIFTNIHGINEEGKAPLPDCKPMPSGKIWFGKQDNPVSPPPTGFFIPPIGAVFIFDEAQKIQWLAQAAGALSKDEQVKSMEEHRHAGLDIIICTQSTNYIHSHIAGLVSPHYYVERPLGLKTTNVFMFNKFQKNPESVTAKKNADDQFMIKLGKGYGKYYQSSAQHNMKATIPLKLKLAVGVFVLFLCYTLYSYSLTRFAKDTNAEVVTDTDTEVVTDTVNNVNKYNPQSSGSMSDTPQELLDKHLPSVIAETVYYEDVRPAMIIASDVSCKAFNTYGERLRIDNTDCYLMSNDPSFIPRSRSVQAQASSYAEGGTLVTPSVNPVVNSVNLSN